MDEVSAPLYVDLVMWALYATLASTVVATVVAAVHGVRTRSEQHTANSRLLRHVALATAALTLAVVAVSYAAASTNPLTINGQPFTSATWLRLTDMFIYSSVTLIILCCAIIVAARFRR